MGMGMCVGGAAGTLCWSINVPGVLEAGKCEQRWVWNESWGYESRESKGERIQPEKREGRKRWERQTGHLEDKRWNKARARKELCDTGMGQGLETQPQPPQHQAAAVNICLTRMGSARLSLSLWPQNLLGRMEVKRGRKNKARNISSFIAPTPATPFLLPKSFVHPTSCNLPEPPLGILL